MKNYLIVFLLCLTGCASKQSHFDNMDDEKEILNVYLFEDGQDINKDIDNINSNPSVFSDLARSGEPVVLRNTLNGDLILSRQQEVLLVVMLLAK